MMTPAWLISLVTEAVRLFSEKAAAEIERRRAEKAAQAAAKAKQAERDRLHREALAAAQKAAQAKAEYEARMAKLDEATRQLVLARNEADLRNMIAVLPDVDEVYPLDGEDGEQ